MQVQMGFPPQLITPDKLQAPSSASGRVRRELPQVEEVLSSWPFWKFFRMCSFSWSPYFKLLNCTRMSSKICSHFWRWLQDFFSQPSVFGKDARQDLAFSMGVGHIGAPQIPQVSLEVNCALSSYLVSYKIVFLWSAKPAYVWNMRFYMVCSCAERASGSCSAL
jgi:hypothetical protein